MTATNQPQNTKKDLDKLLVTLIENGVSDDQNFTALRQFSDGIWEVSFNGVENISFAMGSAEYHVIHKELNDKRCYNAKLIDGALLQLMYRFSGNNLVKHRLAFYPSPSLHPFQEDPETYMRDDLYSEIVSRHIVPFPIRFDFDVEVAKDVEHPMCHLTLGDVKGCRIPVSAPLSPRWFIEFILRNFYQTEKHEFISKLPKHNLSFSSTITQRENKLIHLTIPYCIT